MRSPSTRSETPPHRAASFFPALLLTGLVAAPEVPAEDAVSAMGRLEPEMGIVTLTSPISLEFLTVSIVAEMLVETGQDLEAGALVAVMDMAPTVQAALQEAEAEQRLAVKLAESAQARADEACVQARVAEREAQRRQTLLDKGVAGEEEAEAAAGQAESLAASCAAAKVAVRAAEAEIAVAEARVLRRQAERTRTEIRAPFAGRVLKILAWPGETAGHGVVELARVNRMLAIAEVYETDIGRVRVGQSASVSGDALPGPLSGKVLRIRPLVARQGVFGTEPESRKDSRIVEVEVLLDDSAAVANFSNMQVDVLIRP